MSKPLLRALEPISLQRGQRVILHDVSVEIHSHSILTIIGPNGGGKSTLLKVLLGLEQPDKGKIWRQPDLSIGYVPQKFQLNTLLPLTVARFIGLSLPRHHAKRVQAIAAQIGISYLLSQSVHSLSGGELQRALLARALLRNPQLLVLDEPGQGVDVAGLTELYQLLTQLKQANGYGILLVSHDLHLVMAATDQVLCLNRHLCCSGQPEAVSQRPEYKRLFGYINLDSLVIYTHHHDQQHNIHGCVIHPEHKHG